MTNEIDETSSPMTRVHPRWLRIMHWINAVAIVLMVMSGWRIYNADPFLGFAIPNPMTLGGWLAGALQWHFAAMWLVVGNGALYLTCNIASGRFTRRFFPLSLHELAADAVAALKGRLSHTDQRHYNAVQRAAYLFVIVDIAILVLSGLVLWKSVQFPILRELLGGYESARRVHFGAMTALTTFVAVHLAMVALVPRTLRTMIFDR